MTTETLWRDRIDPEVLFKVNQPWANHSERERTKASAY